MTAEAHPNNFVFGVFDHFVSLTIRRQYLLMHKAQAVPTVLHTLIPTDRRLLFYDLIPAMLDIEI
jgi:hypothetical protein